MSEESPLLDTVLDINAASIERADLDDQTLMLVRLAALAAVDAPTGSYLLNLGAAAQTGLSLEDARAVLIAVAPIVGTPKVVSAAGTIAEALGLALAFEEALENIEI
jgi:alkylhydroperoxidase/carboxymuconolactone decarboxylase family protein YurZ